MLQRRGRRVAVSKRTTGLNWRHGGFASLSPPRIAPLTGLSSCCKQRRTWYAWRPAGATPLRRRRRRQQRAARSRAGWRSSCCLFHPAARFQQPGEHQWQRLYHHHLAASGDGRHGAEAARPRLDAGGGRGAAGPADWAGGCFGAGAAGVDGAVLSLKLPASSLAQTGVSLACPTASPCCHPVPHAPPCLLQSRCFSAAPRTTQSS